MAHKTADPASLSVKTDPPNVVLGAVPHHRPRPDISGLRVKLPTDPKVYLIDPRGFRRWIPDPTTYNNLFRDWAGIVIDIDINEIPEASPLTSTAVLVKSNTAPVYLVSNGMRRWITSPEVMDKYTFAWERILTLPPSVVDSIRRGPDWT